MTTQTQRLPITALPCVALRLLPQSVRSFVRSFVAPAALPRHLHCVDVVVVVVVFIVASHWTRGLSRTLDWELCLDRSRLPLFVWAMSAWTSSSFFSAQQVQLLKIPEFACVRVREGERGQ